MTQLAPITDDEKKYNKDEEILWCDSDPNIKYSATVIVKYGYKLVTFNETADCISYIKNHKFQTRIKAVITSSMKRGGRKEKGLLNGLQMFDVFRNKSVWSVSYAQILAVITAGGLLIDECAEYGIKIHVKYDRTEVQKRVLHMLGSYGAALKNMKLAFASKPTLSCAKNRTQCWKFLTSLLTNNAMCNYFDSFGNHCFCSKCEVVRSFPRGNPPQKYVLPIGWYRFGIKIRNDMKKMRLKMESWHVAYHGTPTDRVESIMEHQRIMFPGDKLNNGTILPVRLGACFADQVSPDGKVIYISPTIKYSGQWLYAKPKKWINNLAGQVVFQCRVKPKCYKKFSSTFGPSNICDQIPNNEVEWITADKTGVAPYAVLVRLMPQNAFPSHVF